MNPLITALNVFAICFLIYFVGLCMHRFLVGFIVVLCNWLGIEIRREDLQ